VELQSGAVNNNYFCYDNENTLHMFEAGLGYSGPEKFPISIFAGTFVYGWDPKDATSVYGNYSTYIELGYALSIKDINLDVFVGATTHQGYYGNYAGVINCGLTGSKDIVINDTFSIPTSFSLITNPQRENIHFVLGFSF